MDKNTPNSPSIPNNPPPTANSARLRWACRRGMLELDLFLEPFFEQAYPTLTPEEQQTFVRLLEFPDPDLFAWFMGHAQSDDEALQALVESIRQFSKQGHKAPS